MATTVQQDATGRQDAARTSGLPPEQYLLFRQRPVRVSGWILLAERHLGGARHRLWLGRNELGSATLHASCTHRAAGVARTDWGWWCRVDDDARRRLAALGLALDSEPCERTDRPAPDCHARVAYRPRAGAPADATALRLPARRCPTVSCLSPVESARRVLGALASALVVAGGR